jgi:hypothetical protein
MHRADVARWKIMASRCPDGRNLFGWIARRLPSLGVIQGAAHPSRDRKPLAFCESLDF